MIIGIIIVLCIAAFTDIKSLKVPLWLTGTGVMLQTIYYVYAYQLNRISIRDINNSVVCGIILFFISFFIMQLGGKLGGADAMLSFLIGYSLSLYGFWAIILSYIFVLPYTAYMRITKTEHEYPFVPYLLLGYLVTLCTIQYFTGETLIWIV